MNEFNFDFKKIDEWRTLIPEEPQYVRYALVSKQPNLIFAGKKVEDIYWAISIARMNLIFLNNKNWGDQLSDDNSEEQNGFLISILKAQHTQNALLNYRCAVDYSWKLIYFFLTIKNDISIKQVTYDELSSKKIRFLEFNRIVEEHSDIKKLFHSFFTDEKNENGYEFIRCLTNDIKHAGTIYFEEQNFPLEDGKPFIEIGGVEQLLTRRTLKMSEAIEQMLIFDPLIVDYLEKLYSIIFHDEYKSNKIDINNFIF